MRTLSGNHGGWLTVIAKEIREAGKPVSLDFLCAVVPGQFATSQNDGHVTAAENGLSRDDFAAGQRIWVEETVAVLLKSSLVDDVDGGYVWTAEQDGTWKVKFGRRTYTLHGRAESLAARDRHMLGDKTAPGYLLKGWSEVEVEIEVGTDEIRKGRHALQVHPLAFAIPPMTPAEQEQIRADIAEHGVRVPLTLYPDTADKTARGKPKLKVLDGRHRLQFASALDKPVRVEVFEGDEIEARQFVSSLNLHRRHLTPQQRALSIVRLFGEEGKAEAKADQIRKPESGDSVPTSSSEQNGNKSDDGEWYDRAWKLAGGETTGVTKHSVRAMGTVALAPETAAKVEAGVIRSTEKALREAKAEIAGIEVEPPKTGGAVSTEKTQNDLIGQALYYLRRAAEADDSGKATPTERNARLTEIIKLAESLQS